MSPTRREQTKCFASALKQTSGPLNTEPPCHYRHSACLSCKHELPALPPPPITGYHAECHTPAIEPEADSDSWICRQCVFAVATKVRTANLPVSHSRGGQTNIQRVIWETFSHIHPALMSRYWQKHANSLGAGFDIGGSTLCPRNHEESIFMKLKDSAGVERSTFKVNPSHMLHFCRYEMKKAPRLIVNRSTSISHCPDIRRFGHYLSRLTYNKMRRIAFPPPSPDLAAIRGFADQNQSCPKNVFVFFCFF